MADGARLRATALRWPVIVALITPPLLWATNFILARAMRSDLPPITLSFLRSVIALAVAAPFALPRLRADLDWYRAHWLRVVLIGLPGVTLFNTIVYVGLHFTSATNGLLLNSTIPMLILVLGALFWGRKIRAVQVLGLAVSTLGVVTIIVQGDWNRLIGFEVARGDLIVLIAMVGWAFYTLGLAGIPAEVNRIGLLFVHLILATLTLLPVFLWSLRAGAVPVWTPESIGAVVYIGVMPSFVALMLFMRGVALAGPALAGQAIHLMPVYGAIFAALFLGETLHPYHAAGFIAILAGIVLASRR